MSPWITSNASTRQLMSSSCNAGIAAALGVICRQHDLLDWRIWQSGAGWAAVHHAMSAVIPVAASSAFNADRPGAGCVERSKGLRWCSDDAGRWMTCPPWGVGADVFLDQGASAHHGCRALGRSTWATRRRLLTPPQQAARLRERSRVALAPGVFHNT